jgi:hypothetical protein
MSPNIAELFLDHSIRKLDQMTAAIDLCLARLIPEQIWSRAGAHENAIGNLVLHLCGNITQLIGHCLAGDPDIRDRPAEFAAAHLDPSALSSALHGTIARATATLRALPHARLPERVVTRDGERSVLEVIYQVVGHFQQHAGQIIFATKQLTGEDLAIYQP